MYPPRIGRRTRNGSPNGRRYVKRQTARLNRRALRAILAACDPDRVDNPRPLTRGWFD